MLSPFQTKDLIQVNKIHGREIFEIPRRGCDFNSEIVKWPNQMVNFSDIPMDAGYLRKRSFPFTKWRVMKIYLDNVHATKKRERKGEESLFKSGQKNPLGISDLLRVQLDVSNEWTVVVCTIAVWENYALIDPRTWLAVSAVEGCIKVSLHLDKATARYWYSLLSGTLS